MLAYSNGVVMHARRVGCHVSLYAASLIHKLGEDNVRLSIPTPTTPNCHTLARGIKLQGATASKARHDQHDCFAYTRTVTCFERNELPTFLDHTCLPNHIIAICNPPPQIRSSD